VATPATAADGSSLPGLAVRLRGISGLTRDSLFALVVTALAQGLALVLQVLLARFLGPAEFGAYSFAIAALGIALILAKGGLDTALVRLVAASCAAGDAVRLGAVVRFATRVAPALGAVLGALGVAAAAGACQPPVPFAVLAVTAALLPVAARSEINAAALRGLRRIGTALAGDGILRPLATILALPFLWAAGSPWATAAGALTAYALGTCLSVLLTTAVLRREVPSPRASLASSDSIAMLRMGGSLMVANGSLAAMYSVDALLLAVLRSPTEAGILTVASRVAMFVLFVMNAAQLAAAPRLAAVSGDIARMRSVVRTLNRLSVTAGLAVAGLLFASAGPVLALFGPGFEVAVVPLRILIVGQVLNVLTGPTGVLLSMTGRENALAVLLAGGLAAQVALLIALAPTLGATGAALAGTAGGAVWNLAAAFLLRRGLGFDVTALDLARRA
jgi:O-antigen/teichoic acid export membrane protein